jgi:hypothetical protein
MALSATLSARLLGFVSFFCAGVSSGGGSLRFSAAAFSAVTLA